MMSILAIKLKSVFLHITLSKITSAFFLFSLIQCFASGLIQSFLFTTDLESSSLINAIVSEAKVPTDVFARFYKTGGVYSVHLCGAIPEDKTTSPCYPTFSSNMPNLTSGQVDAQQTFELQSTLERGVSVQSVNGSSDVSVISTNANGSTNITDLSYDCAKVLLYPMQVLNNSKREDLSLIGAQFWLFAISFFGIVYDSIPHIIAALIFRYLSLGWSAFQLWRTYDIADRFHGIVSGQDTFCQAHLFPTYFQIRTATQIPDLVLNFTGVIAATYLSWRLIKAYSRFIFGRVAPTAIILKVYKWFLCIFVCLQLLVYLMVTSMALWVDQLFNSAITVISSHTKIYVSLFIFTLVFLLPWIMFGWYSVRHERKHAMAVFLTITFVFVACWAIMFYSLVYRFTFIDWPFFACTTVASFMVLIPAFIFGVISWLNFGKGLAEYLRTEKTLEKADFEPELFERDVEQNAGHYDDTAQEWSDITVTLKFDGSGKRPLSTSSEDSTAYDIKESALDSLPALKKGPGYF